MTLPPQQPPVAPAVEPDDEAMAMLAALRDQAVAPAPLSHDLRERLWTRVAARTMASPQAQASGALLQSIYQHEGWARLDDKAEMKVLFDDGDTVSWLLRLAPGGTVLPHAHAGGAEECLVMAGTVLLNGLPYAAGDYQLALPGSRHERIHSEGGCVVFLRSPSSRRRELKVYATAHRVWSPLQRAARRLGRLFGRHG